MNKTRHTKPQIAKLSESEEKSDSPSPRKTNKQQQLQNKKTAKNKGKIQSDEQDSAVIVENIKNSLKAQKVVNNISINPLKKITKRESSDQPSDSSQEKPQKKILITNFPPQTALNKKKPLKKQTSQEQQSEQQQTKKIIRPNIVKAPLSLKNYQKLASQSEQSSKEQAPKKSIKTQLVSKVKSPLQKLQTMKKKKQSSEQEQEKLLEQAIHSKSENKAIIKMTEKQKTERLEANEPKAQLINEVQIDEQGQFQICVKGLSFYANQNDIDQLFQPIGNILNLKLLMREDGKSKGLAFVKFTSKNSYNKALELNGTQHLGRDITIEPSLTKKNSNRNRNNHQQVPVKITSPTLFVGGISFNTNKESIFSLFGSVGEVVSVHVVTDKQTGKSKGFGYVQFKDVETAKKAYQTLNSKRVDGRQLRIDNATQKTKSRIGKKDKEIFKLIQDNKIINRGSLATFRGSLVTK